MKNYLVFVDGIEQKERIQAKDHNEALDKAKRKYPAKWIVSVFLETF